MKPIKSGGPRQATATSRLSAANDLVRQTLARHGLSADLPFAQGVPQMPPSPFAGMPFGAAPTQESELPTGARFEAGTFTGPTGSRSYRMYVPASAPRGLRGIVMMLHGCTQTSEDFAMGTGMNALAEADRFVVIYPQQARGSNAQSCWNWFSRGDQRRDAGEPAILAGLARQMMIQFSILPQSSFVAGLSAGAAMAVILGETYPDVFAAVGAHSGLPFGAAKDMPSAFAAMAGQGGEAVGQARGKAVRTITFHGTADHTVHPGNSDRIARDVADRAGRQTRVADETGVIGGRSFTCATVSTLEGTPLSEQWTVQGLGHAWSGGKPGGSYTDPQGPDASAEMVRFFFDRRKAVE